jgi:malonyl-CoA/methylmalonyl-CoA synthetase
MANSAETLFVHLGAMIAGAVRVPVNAAYTGREAAHPVETTGAKVVVREVPSGAPADPRPHDLSMICFTSGTSGKPKGVPLTHANLESNIRGLAEVWEWTERDTLLLTLPLNHLHGLGNGLNGWILTGCTMILHPKFEPAAAMAALPGATMFFGVPAMYHRLAETPRPLPGIRLWACGSAPLDRGLEDRWAAAFGRPIVNRYGMTETCMITANPARAPKPGSVGRPLPGMEVKILPSGEIAVRGPSVFSGYWGGETDVTGFEDGWFRTGDLGRLDGDGYLAITGRAKDIIISGGTNIAPVEIEEVLLSHPGVAEAVAVPIPDPALGEVIRAVVVPREPLTVETVQAWCAERLAKFKRPRDVRIVETPLPRNSMGKLDRKRAKEVFGPT